MMFFTFYLFELISIVKKISLVNAEKTATCQF